MTPEQQQRILDVIAQDANGAGSLYRPSNEAGGNPEYCVLGGLALAAGWDNNKLDSLNGQNYQDLGLYALLEDRYGLTAPQAESLVLLNDSQVDTDTRRRVLSAQVRAYTTIEAGVELSHECVDHYKEGV